jgi:hypothetical protein
VGLYIRLSYFHPFQQFFIHIDKFYPFFIHYSSNLPTLNNVKKIVWPTVYAVLGVVKSRCDEGDFLLLVTTALLLLLIGHANQRVIISQRFIVGHLKDCVVLGKKKMDTATVSCMLTSALCHNLCETGTYCKN